MVTVTFHSAGTENFRQNFFKLLTKVAHSKHELEGNKKFESQSWALPNYCANLPVCSIRLGSLTRGNSHTASTRCSQGVARSCVGLVISGTHGNAPVWLRVASAVRAAAINWSLISKFRSIFGRHAYASSSNIVAVRGIEVPQGWAGVAGSLC